MKLTISHSTILKSQCDNNVNVIMSIDTLCYDKSNSILNNKKNLI